jgi:hypothetical protein
MFGKNLAFKEAATWDAPIEVVAFDYPHRGRVRVEARDNMNVGLYADIPFDAIRAVYL